MNSQKTITKEIYPEDFEEEDKLRYDVLLEQAKILFPKMINEEWALRCGIIAFMRKEKQGIDTNATEEEINKIKQNYDNEAVYYTEPVNEPLTNEPPNIITVE